MSFHSILKQPERRALYIGPGREAVADNKTRVSLGIFLTETAPSTGLGTYMYLVKANMAGYGLFQGCQ